MKFLLLLVVAGCVSADFSHILGKSHTQDKEKEARIVRYEQDASPEGAYKWGYETDNGIVADETGDLKNGPDGAFRAAQGRASWTSSDGQLVSFEYQADENGYQAQGPFIPTPPPIPEHIIRALQYLKDHPPAPEKY